MKRTNGYVLYNWRAVQVFQVDAVRVVQGRESRIAETQEHFPGLLLEH